ncbi:MAG: hypothetical protein C0392_15975 [Syntrophus sp. (in: bacteria)]|nr:hypothetical protein [Syntrophus sp. (in: bacteria)]
MGILGLFANKGQQDDKNTLEIARQDKIQVALDSIYQDFFTNLSKVIPMQYMTKFNEVSWSTGVNDILSKEVDATRQVVAKASYDAIKSVGLKTGKDPHITIEPGLGGRGKRITVVIAW